MPISSSDILNLSHALKDICEVDCDTYPLLTRTLRLVAQSNLLQAHLLYSQALSEACCQENSPFYRHKGSLQQDDHYRLMEKHGQRQEGFNLHFIHEHSDDDYDHDDCDSDDCD